MKIYTKTGDKGKTSLFDGTRVSKNNLRVESYGTIDEVNVILGVVCSFLEKQAYSQMFKTHIEEIQNDLFDIGAYLANPSKSTDSSLSEKLANHSEKYEGFIDSMTEKMPNLMNFILPGGGQVGAFLHVARATVRRAERVIVALSQKEVVEGNILVYINRLSDVFFTMSRFANFTDGQKEVIWQK